MLLRVLKEKMLLLVGLGFIAGIILGLRAPDLAVHFEFIGVAFLNSIKLMIVPLIFCSVFLGVIDNQSQRIGRLLINSIITFVCLFCVTLLVAFPIAFLVNPGQDFNSLLLTQTEAQAAAPVTLTTIVNNLIPTNIFEPFVTSNILQVIIITLVLSCGLIRYKAEIEPVISFIRIISELVFKILDVIMLLSPFAVFGLIATTTATYGLDALRSLSQYIFTSYILFVIVMIIVVLVPIKIVTKFKFSHIIKTMAKLWVISISTASSTATLPTTFEVVENEFGVATDRAQFILPLSTTLNMIGGAVSFSVLSVFATNISSIPITPMLLIEMIFLSIIINMSAPGIPGGGIVLGTIYLTTLGIPTEVMVLIAGIYRIVDMAFTTLNVSGDVVAAVIINKVYELNESTEREFENE